MRIWLSSILLCFMVTSVRCEGNFFQNFWTKAQEMAQSAAESFRNSWSSFTNSVSEAASNIKGRTQEAWNNFKEGWNERVDSMSDVSEQKKTEMKDYIERLQMPEEE